MDLLQQLSSDYPPLSDEKTSAAKPRFYTKLLSLSSKPLRPDKHTLTCGAVSGGIGLFGFSNGTVLRWKASTATNEKLTLASGILTSDTGASGTGTSVPFSTLTSATAAITASGLTRSATKHPGKVEAREVFLGPQGYHGIVGFSNGLNCYTHLQSTVCRPILSLKNLHITSVCWNARGTRLNLNSTNEFLIAIFSTVISGGRERTVRSVYICPQRISILHIFITPLPSTTTTDSNDSCAPPRFNILVTTPTQLLQFTGGPTLESAFQQVKPIKSVFATNPSESDCPESNCDNNAANIASNTSPASTLLSGLGAFTQQQHINDMIVSKMPLFSILECPGDGLIGEVHITEQQQFMSSKNKNDGTDVTSKDTLLWWLTSSAVIIARFRMTFVHQQPSQLVLTLPTTIIPFPSPIVLRRVSLTTQNSMLLDSGDGNVTPVKKYRFRLRGRSLTTNNHDIKKYQVQQLPAYNDLDFSNHQPSVGQEYSHYRSMVITDGYILLLQETRLIIMSRDTHAIVETLSLAPVRYGTAKYFMKDSETEKFVFEVLAEHEAESAWAQLLGIKNYSTAAKVTKSPHIRNILLDHYGKLLYKAQEFRAALSVWASCETIPFEDLILLILSHHNHTTERASYHHLSFLLSEILSRFTAFMLPPTKNIMNRCKDHTHSTSSENVKGIGLYKPGILETFLACLNIWLLETTLTQLNFTELFADQLKHELHFYNNALLENCHNTIASTIIKKKENVVQGLKKNLLIQKQLPGRIKRLLQLLTDSDEYKVVIHELCERLGRYSEVLLWANLIHEQERPVLEFLSQDAYSDAILSLDRDPPRLQATYQELQRLAVKKVSTPLNWREVQIHLIAKYGPCLFLHQPVKFARLILRSDYSPTQPARHSNSAEIDGLGNAIDQALQTPEKGFVEALLPVVAGSLSSLLSPYTDLHRCQALKILEKTLQIVSRRRIIGPPGSWNYLKGIWNMTSMLLISCSGTELEFIKKLSMFRELVVEADIQSLLRACAEKGQYKAIVTLLTLQKLFESAVKVALWAQDFEMAKFAVRRVPSKLSQLKQKLWRRIAEEGAKVLSASDLLLLLEESDGILKLHEVLDYASTTSVIGAFRDDLCQAFDACERRVKEKQEDIYHNLKALLYLKRRLKEHQARILKTVRPNSLCLHCRRPILLDRFYVFPCRHAIHALCAHRLLFPHMNIKQKEQYRKALSELAHALSTVPPPISNTPQSFYSPNLHRTATIPSAFADLIRQREREVDHCLAEDCPLCGTLAISAIGVPFLTSNEAAGSSWTMHTA